MKQTIATGLAAAVIMAMTAAACGGGSSGSTPTSPTTTTPAPTTPTTPTSGTPTDSATITIGANGAISPTSVTISRDAHRRAQRRRSA